MAVAVMVHVLLAGHVARKGEAGRDSEQESQEESH
jgi:hypothetical protein